MKKAIDTSKYAVIETGGKQHVVHAGEIVKIAKLDDDKNVGDKVVFDKVLLVDDGSETKVGAPYVKGHKIEGELVENGRDKKVTVIKYKSKSNYFIKRGHRQHFAKVQINKI